MFTNNPLSFKNYKEYIYLATTIFPQDFNVVKEVVDHFINKDKIYDEWVVGGNILEYWIVQDKEKLIGISGLYSFNKEECWLGWFGVHPDFRKQGYGTKIFTESFNVAKNNGYKYLSLRTDYNAVDFYNKIGLRQFKSKEYLDQICFTTKDTKWIIA